MSADGLFVVDSAYVDADVDCDGDDEDEEKEILEQTTSTEANRGVVGAVGFQAVGPAVVVGSSLARFGMGLTGRALK